MSTRNAAEDALPLQKYSRLYQAAQLTRHREKQTENEWITVGTGRLSLRKGALLHARPDWLDRRRKMIEVPKHDGCSCTYCQNRAEERVERADGELTYEEALDEQWQPKYPASARTIYYGFNAEVVEIVERFFDTVGQLDYHPSTINRRVDRLAERAGLDDETVYPHCLRATAATFWARQGMIPTDLQALCGWADIRVAQKYIRLTGEQVAEGMRGCLEETDPESVLHGYPEKPTSVASRNAVAEDMLEAKPLTEFADS